MHFCTRIRSTISSIKDKVIILVMRGYELYFNAKAYFVDNIRINPNNYFGTNNKKMFFLHHENIPI